MKLRNFTLLICILFITALSALAQGLPRGATLPATCNVNNLFYLTSEPGRGLYLCTEPDVWTPDRTNKFTPPSLDDFTWVNQGGATATQEGATIALTGPPAWGDNMRMLLKAAPTAPYTIEVAFTFSAPQANYHHVGFIWRESGSGKLVTAGRTINDGPTNFASARFNDPTSYAGAYLAQPWTQAGIHWIKVEDDGTNRKVYISSDGKTWILGSTQSRTDHLTADQVGFGISVNQASFPASMTLLHWKEY